MPSKDSSVPAERPVTEAPRPARVVDPAALDPRAVRRAFGRAAATYTEAAVLQREVGARMAGASTS